jgi:hypothetical protein
MLDPGSSLLKPKNKHPTPKQARPTTPIRVHLRHLSACICVNRLTRDPLGWQNPFATETGGLFQTGNSVASAEQTSAALKLHKLTRIKTGHKDKRPTQKQAPDPKASAPHNPNPRSSAPFIRVNLRETLDPGSSAQGWQSPFATETGGLFQTGNSVASAEQTSAALKLHKLTRIKTGHKDKRPTQKQAPDPKASAPHNPNPRSSAPFIRENLREPLDYGSSLLEKACKGGKGGTMSASKLPREVFAARHPGQQSRLHRAFHGAAGQIRDVVPGQGGEIQPQFPSHGPHQLDVKALRAQQLGLVFTRVAIVDLAVDVQIVEPARGWLQRPQVAGHGRHPLVLPATARLGIFLGKIHLQPPVVVIDKPVTEPAVAEQRIFVIHFHLVLLVLL